MRLPAEVCDRSRGNSQVEFGAKFLAIIPADLFHGTLRASEFAEIGFLAHHLLPHELGDWSFKHPESS